MSTALTPAASSTGASKRMGAGSNTAGSVAAAAPAPVSHAHADIGLAPNNWLQQRLQAAEIEQQRAQRKTDAKIDRLIKSKVVDLGVPAMRSSAAAASVQSPSLPTATDPSLATAFPDLFSGGAALLASLTGQGGASSHRSSICSSMNQKSSKVMISHTRVKIKDARSNREAAAAAAAAATAAASAQAAVAPVAAASAPAASSARSFGTSFTAARISTARSTNRVAPGAATAAGARSAFPLGSVNTANAALKPAVPVAPVAGSGGRGQKRSNDAVTAATAAVPAASAASAPRNSGHGSAKKRKLGDAPAAGSTPLRHSARLTLGSPALGSLLTTPQAAEKEIRIEETPMRTGGSGATSGHGRTPQTGATKGAGGSAQPVGFRVRKKLFGSPDQSARPPSISAGSASSFALRLSPAANAAAATATASTPSPGSSHRSLFVGATPSPSSRRTPGQSGASSSRSAHRDLSPTAVSSVAKVHPSSPSVSPTVATRLGKHHSIKRPLQFDDPATTVAVDPVVAEQPELPVVKKARRGENSSVGAAPLAFGSFSIHSSVVLSGSSSGAAPHRALSIVPEGAVQQEEEEAAAEMEQPRKPAGQRKPRKKHTGAVTSAASSAPRETRSSRAR